MMIHESATGFLANLSRLLKVLVAHLYSNCLVCGIDFLALYTLADALS